MKRAKCEKRVSVSLSDYGTPWHHVQITTDRLSRCTNSSNACFIWTDKPRHGYDCNHTKYDKFMEHYHRVRVVCVGDFPQLAAIINEHSNEDTFQWCKECVEQMNALHHRNPMSAEGLIFLMCANRKESTLYQQLVRDVIPLIANYLRMPVFPLLKANKKCNVSWEQRAVYAGLLAVRDRLIARRNLAREQVGDEEDED